jgi:hypothetical protein
VVAADASRYTPRVDLATLADVILWGLARTPPAVIADVIVHDEYTHDVLLPDGARWLVFDTT